MVKKILLAEIVSMISKLNSDIFSILHVAEGISEESVKTIFLPQDMVNIRRKVTIKIKALFPGIKFLVFPFV